MPSPENVVIPASSGDLPGLLFRPQERPRSLAVISHGLLSNKDSEKLGRLAKALARAGHLALIFDHSGCGQAPGNVEDTTLTSRRDEFLAAVETLEQMEPERPLVYLGSSFGGTVAMLASDIEPAACTLHWSTPWDFANLARRMETEPDHPHFSQMLFDLQGHDLEALLSRSSRAFFVHGGEDELVSVEQAKRAHQLARDPKGLLIIDSGDHRLSDVKHQDQAVAASLAWIDRFVS